MPDHRRYHVPGATYFFTLVTHQRRRFLTSGLGRRCLREAFEEELKVRPFEIVAIVLLPDHLHTLWALPEGDARYSVRWRRVKERFTNAYLAAGGTEGDRSASRLSRQERGVWQRRFWEHVVRDGDDFKRCLDYIHCNPVRHGLARNAAEYPWSAFHRWVGLGEYDLAWGTGEVTVDVAGAEWEGEGLA
jgi:putative transposase